MQRGVGGVAVAAVNVAGAPLVDDVGVVLRALVEVVGRQPDGRRHGLLIDRRRLVALVDGSGGEAWAVHHTLGLGSLPISLANHGASLSLTSGFARSSSGGS